MAKQPEIQEEPARPRIPPGVVVALLLGCVGCILFGIRDCRKQAGIGTALAESADVPAEGIPAPAATNLTPTAAEPISATAAQPSAVSTNALTAEERNAQALAAANAAFDRYLDQIRRVDFEGASNSWRTIDGLLTTVDLRTNFWDRALPVEIRSTLTLARLCLICSDGSCWRCDATGQCPACEGLGTCQTCKGDSVRMRRCAACRCATCQASGTCVTCKGQALSQCGACAGSGRAPVAGIIMCPSCDGSGARSGLKRAGGEASKSMCLTCRGSGKRPVTQTGTCVTCGGRGQTACATCQGSGKCATCTGLGRRALCETCTSTGLVRVECPTCKGKGRCKECGGSKLCANCVGKGKCPHCSGEGIVRIWSLPVDADWMARRVGFVVNDTQTGYQLASGSSAGPQALKVRNRALAFPVQSNEVVWIGTDVGYRGIRTLVQPR